MNKMIRDTWVNLPIKSLKDSVGLFGTLGFEFNKQFNSICMILNDNIMVTLVEEPRFKEFAQKGEVWSGDLLRERQVTWPYNALTGN